MDEIIMIGCDLHEQNMLLKIAVGRERLVLDLQNRAVGPRRRVAGCAG